MDRDGVYRLFLRSDDGSRLVLDGKPVAEVNRLLVEAEVRPLTNLVDGFDENGWKVVNE